MTRFPVFLTATLLFLTVAAFGQGVLPSVDLKTLDGQTVNLQDVAVEGKPTIISLWATWCSPCKRELDTFADLYEDWQEEYDVTIVAITTDDRRSLPKVGPMVETKGWPFQILSDPNQGLRSALNFQTIPLTLLINGEGEIVYRHSGYQMGDEEEMEEQLEALK